MKTITIIAAMTRSRVIGKDGQVPWHEPEDLKHFKRTTTGHAVIMGRKTFESVGKPLPGRRNIVITRNVNYELPAAAKAQANPAGAGRADPSGPDLSTTIDVVHSLDEALQLCRHRNEERAFVIGGAQIYEQALAVADELIITEIDHDDVVGDTHFPVWDPGQWRPAEFPTDAPLRIVRYVRKIRGSRR